MRSLRELFRQEDGTAALEFALLVPLLAFLFFGTVEAALVLRASWKVASAAQAIANLVAQQVDGVSASTTGSLANFCEAGELVMTPYPTGGSLGVPYAFTADIVSVTNLGGTVAADWEIDTGPKCATTSDGTGFKAAAVTRASTPISGTGTGLPSCTTTGTVDLLPCAYDSIIMVQVSYNYSSPFQFILPSGYGLGLPTSFGTTTLTGLGYARPRGPTTMGNTTIPCIETPTGSACAKP